MNRMLLAAALSGSVLFTGGCRSKAANKDAIRDGVVKHISEMKGLNVNNMNITVTKTTINGDKAQADVDIRAKNSDPSAPGMEMTYDLEKQGDQWVVTKGQASGGAQHFNPNDLPKQGTMPPGHPATGGAGGQPPANHPDFNSILNGAQSQQPQSGGQSGSQQQPAANTKP